MKAVRPAAWGPTVRAMYVYVSGPYSAPNDVPAGERASIIEQNIQAANEAGLALLRAGHFPFVPHTMMAHWEDRYGVEREPALDVCIAWVRRCDGLLVLGSSAGAHAEVEAAVEAGLPIYHSLAAVPGPLATA